MERYYTDYDSFARIYNRHWGDRFVPRAVAACEQLVLADVPAGGRILDLCCGTGQLAHVLSGRGYRVTGIDGSEEMISIARENAPGVEFIRADARDFHLPGRFDLVVSAFDSLNHVMRRVELDAVFRNVYESLVPGGKFLFDLNTEAAYLKDWEGAYGIVEDEYVFVSLNRYNPVTSIGHFHITIFRLDENGDWRRNDVKLTQRWYSDALVYASLKEAGFTDHSVYSTGDDFRFVPRREETDRSFFLCTRPS